MTDPVKNILHLSSSPSIVITETEKVKILNEARARVVQETAFDSLHAAHRSKKSRQIYATA